MLVRPSNFIEGTNADFPSNGLLARIHKHAGAHSLASEFPTNDPRGLRKAGYLSAFVSEGYENVGLSLEEIMAEQTRLAKVTPGTVLDVNIHQTIVGLGHHLPRNGNSHGEIILCDTVTGELCGLGTPKLGNDLVFFDSITETLLDSEGGYSLERAKVFTSLIPVWTRLTIFGRGNSGEDEPYSVFAILKHEDGGFSIKNDWNTLGMHTTRSNTTILEGACAPEDRILTCRELDPSKDPVVFGISSRLETLLTTAYIDVGGRVIEIAAECAKARHSVKNQSTCVDNPDIRWKIVETTITMNAVSPRIHGLARDIEGGVDQGPIWMPQLSTAKNAAAEASLRAAKQSIRACGGGTYYGGHESSRLYRDVLARLSQPSDRESLHGARARMVIGLVIE